MDKTAKTCHVIPHTHWDFEWYFSTHESLIQLIYHMDEVMTALETGQTQTYLLDGQLSIVEDYLAHCPEHTERFTRLVQDGKLIIGPWYSQTDQLIISGESIVRNLAMGMQIGAQFGPVMKIGYVPDSFGQSIDMPKIYRGVGIDKTVFWRGLSTDVCPTREFIWTCEDGSQVRGYNIKNGYFVGSYVMDFDDPTPLCQQAEEGTLANNIAIPLGGDQRYVDKEIASRLAVCNQSTADYELVESSYDQLFKALDAEGRDWPTISGELIDGQVSKIHRSIYSSRYDHKFFNDKIERRLCYQLEPLMVMAAQHGIKPKRTLLDQVWKVLMRNHAHDSAGGCNTDKTNKIILARYEQADQMSGSAVDYLVRKLADSQPQAAQGGVDGRITLFNTLPFGREPLIQMSIASEQPHFVLQDINGHPIAFDVLAQEPIYRGSIQRDPSQNDPSLYYYQTQVAFYYALPPSGFVSIQVRDAQVEEALTVCALTPCDATTQGEISISNDRYQLSVKDGQITLFDHQLQQAWPNCLTLLDMGDDGDTYDYSPPAQDWLLTLDWRESRFSVQQGQHLQTLYIEGEWALPQDLTARAERLCNGHMGYRLAISLSDAASPLTMRVELDNQVDDHRVQLVVSAPFNTETSWSDTPFGVVERANTPVHLHDWREAGWKEEPSPIYPMLHMANLHNDDMSLSVLAKGVKEYEMRADNQLALTLFRGVGWLGKPDLQRRPGIASGQQFKYIPTPDSQLRGHIEAEFALVIDRQFDAAAIQRAWQQYAVDVLPYQAQSLNQFTNTLKYFVMHPLTHKVADHAQGITLQSDELVLSALKPTMSGDGVLIRVYNPSSQTVASAGELHLPMAFREMVEVNLREHPVATPVVCLGTVPLVHFKPKQIRSFIVR